MKFAFPVVLALSAVAGCVAADAAATPVAVAARQATFSCGSKRDFTVGGTTTGSNNNITCPDSGSGSGTSVHSVSSSDGTTTIVSVSSSGPSGTTVSVSGGSSTSTIIPSQASSGSSSGKNDAPMTAQAPIVAISLAMLAGAGAVLL